MKSSVSVNEAECCIRRALPLQELGREREGWTGKEGSRGGGGREEGRFRDYKRAILCSVAYIRRPGTFPLLFINSSVSKSGTQAVKDGTFSLT